MAEQLRTGDPSTAARDPFPAILRTPAVLALISLSRTSLWRRVRAGDFPAQ